MTNIVFDLILQPNIDSNERQNAEEKELLEMENDRKLDEEELAKAEMELMEDDEDISENYLDSPYPSDVEDDAEEDEFVVTDRLKDESIGSDNESVIPINDLTARLKELKYSDSESPTPMATSSPKELSEETEGCYNHCDCITCTKCINCGACEQCQTCFKCESACKYSPELLVPNRKGNQKLMTKCVGDKLSLETKSVGDKNRSGSNIVPMSMEEIISPSTAKDSNNNLAKVSAKFSFDFDIVATKNAKEQKTYKFSQRRISINNRRLDFQESFRVQGIIDQCGTIRLLNDSEYWVMISLVGYTEVLIPRFGVDLFGQIKFCPHVKWTVIDPDGSCNWSKDCLMNVTKYLKDRITYSNRVSIKPDIRPLNTQKPIRKPTDRITGGTPARKPRLDKPSVKTKTEKTAPVISPPAGQNQPQNRPNFAPSRPQVRIDPPIQPQNQARRILVGFPALPNGVPIGWFPKIYIYKGV